MTTGTTNFLSLMSDLRDIRDRLSATLDSLEVYHLENDPIVNSELPFSSFRPTVAAMLQEKGIHRYGDLAALNESDVLRFPAIARRGLLYLKNVLAAKGMAFGSVGLARLGYGMRK